MQLTEKQITNTIDKRYKDRDQQYAIMNGERPSLDTPRKIYDKLVSLQKSYGLFYKAYKFMNELQKIH
jgi:hypothetical protein